MPPRRRWLSGVLLLAAAGFILPVVVWAKPLTVAVATVERTHLVWSVAEKWQATLSGTPAALSLAATEEGLPADADVAIVPLSVFARQVPAVSVLGLPFLFVDLPAMHRVLDGALGVALRRASEQAGWQLLALWDEGMQSLSGNQPYNRVQNLAGIEFAVQRPDPVEEKTLAALDAWSRNIRPNSLERMAQECLVDSRSATLQEMWREHLYRVHLNLTLTRHRYEGWVVVAAGDKWKRLSPAARRALQDSLKQITPWEREEAARREAEALKSLTGAGLEVADLGAAERDAMRARLLPLERLLPDAVSPSLGRRLVALAAGGGAGADLGGGGQALPQTQPGAPRRQAGHDVGGASRELR
jgi:TRAP-type C4-dicarboxylate transport system substrate-binding protein